MLPFEEVKRKPEPLTESQVWGAAAPTPVEPEPTWLSVPNEQAWWWHFNGGNYTVPHIFSVMVSNTGTPRYFVQYPDSRWCDEIGGWWLKVEYPNVPTREYMRSSAPAESQGRPAPTQIAAKRYYDRQKEQIAAESQGVERAQPVEQTCEECGKLKSSHRVVNGERACYPDTFPEQPMIFRGPDVVLGAQPVEGPREPTCRWSSGLTQADKWCMTHRSYLCKPVEGVERVTDDAPARVEPQVDVWRGTWGRPEPGTRRDIIGVRDLPDGRKEYLMHNEALGRPYYLAVSAPPAQPAKHTDDRPAETIPKIARWKMMQDSEGDYCMERWGSGDWVKHADYRERTGRAETRIEVLEAALVRLRDCDWVISLPDRMDAVRDIARAALAAPSGVKEKV